MSLSTLYDEIVAKAKVDRSSREIQDISSAVEEMLKRLVSGEIEIKYKKILKFRGADLQQCGSMHEKTSLWKSSRRQGRENKFLECDYVVILHNEDNESRIESGDCQGCRRVVPGERHGWAGERLDPGQLNSDFLRALYSRINSMCSCRVDPDHTLSLGRPPCRECTVDRETGRLQIAKIPDFRPDDVKKSEHCSLVLFWTSRTESLLAPNIETLQMTERIERLVIRVDILAGFEYPGDRDGDECDTKRFIIAKKCPYGFLHQFMVSYFMHELRALKHVSDQHKHCFIIIKFLYGQFIYWTGLDEYINSYHAKVAFLTHCQTCTDEQKDCTTCITEILQSLVEAYRSGSLRLPEFHPEESLEVDHYGYFHEDVKKDYQIPILCLLHVLPQLKTQYRPFHVVGLIKRTCRKLLEQDRPGIMDMDGRPLKNTVSTEDNLAVLLAVKGLCYRVVYNPYDDVEKLYRRLDCPEPERGLLRWRATCMANMMLASDITHIRDETIKQVVADIQDYVKKWGYKQLLFLTSSQSVTGMPKNDSETSSLTHSLDGSCNDTTDRSVPTDSKFTDDLQLNWSALNFTELREKMRRAREKEEKERQAEERRAKEKERQAEERRLAIVLQDIEDRRLIEEIERRKMIQKQKTKKEAENETTPDAAQMEVQPIEVNSSGETDDESTSKNGKERSTDLQDEDENKEDMEDKKDQLRRENSDLKVLVDSLSTENKQLKEEVARLKYMAKERERDQKQRSRLEIKEWSIGDICEGFYDPEKKWCKAKVIKIISQGVYRVKYTCDRYEEDLPQELMRPIEKEN